MIFFSSYKPKCYVCGVTVNVKMWDHHYQGYACVDCMDHVYAADDVMRDSIATYPINLDPYGEEEE